MYPPQFGMGPMANMFMNRFMPQPEPEPVDMVNVNGVWVPAAQMGLAPYRQQRIDHRQAYMVPQTVPMAPPQVAGFGGAYGDAYGAEEAAWEHEDADFGADEREDDADMADPSYGSVERLQRRQAKKKGKLSKWQSKAATARTPWGKGIANLRVNQLNEDIEKRDDKIARKMGGGGEESARDMLYVHQSAPPGEGRQVAIDLYPETAPAGNHVGAIDNPVLRSTIPAGAVETSSLTVVTKSLQYATYAVTGLAVEFHQKDNGVTVLGRNFKAQGANGLFVSDDWHDLSKYDLSLNKRLGLRTGAIIDRTNVLKLELKVVGPANAVASFSPSVIADVLEDSVPSTNYRRMSRQPGPYLNAPRG